MSRITLTALLAALAATAVGCAADDDDMQHDEVDCATETRADTYVAGLEKQGSQLIVSLVSDPAPPTKGDNVWTLTVTDLDGNPMDGLSLDSQPFMPDHGHGTPNQESQSDGSTVGEYVLSPINLWMPGYWEVTIAITGDSIDDSVMFKPCIDG